MSRRLWLWLSLAALVGLFSLGFVRWDVTGPVRWACGRFLVGGTRWQVWVGHAQWVPWRGLKVEDVWLASPGGGRLHLVRLFVFPRPWMLARGSLEAQCAVGEIRMDPGSWRIRRPEAQEILSAMPVTADGFLNVRYRWGSPAACELVLHGPLLRVQGKGSFDGAERAEFSARGEVIRLVLEAMHVIRSDQVDPSPWEPFELELRGALFGKPHLRFTSAFYSLLSEPKEWGGS